MADQDPIRLEYQRTQTKGITPWPVRKRLAFAVMFSILMFTIELGLVALSDRLWGTKYVFVPMQVALFPLGWLRLALHSHEPFDTQEGAAALANAIFWGCLGAFAMHRQWRKRSNE